VPDALAIANEIANPRGFRAEILQGVHSVGVGGDQRLYRPVICLVGPLVDHAVIAEISTAISNRTGGCRIALETAHRGNLPTTTS
jgi:hypothetical protein